MRHLARLAVAVAVLIAPASAAAADRTGLPTAGEGVAHGLTAAAMFADRQAQLGRPLGPDACAGRTVPVTVVDLPGDLAGDSDQATCAIRIDPVVTLTAWAACDAVEHERLHLWRGDDWHSDDPAHPLYPRAVTMSRRCLELMPLPTDTLRIRDARARLRDRLAPEWRIRAVSVRQAPGPGVREVTFRARRAGGRVREYLAFRDWGTLRVQRTCLAGRPVGCSG